MARWAIEVGRGETAAEGRCAGRDYEPRACSSTDSSSAMVRGARDKGNQNSEGSRVKGRFLVVRQSAQVAGCRMLHGSSWS